MKQFVTYTHLQTLFALFFCLPVEAQRATPPTNSIATVWADMTVQTMTRAPQNTPTYGSRALGYLGLTMYETVVYSSKKHRSFARKLSDTLRLPVPDPRQSYCWELALTAGQAYMLKAFYGYTKNTSRVDSLADALHKQYAATNPADVVERSERFGQTVAEKIYQWSKSDGGHEGYKRNFPTDYKLPQGDGLWVPPIVGQSEINRPMHPTWGQNRTFVRSNSQLAVPEPLRYSTDSTSRYYKEYREVYDRQKQLSQSDREIVFWWGDDPSESCSPPGHSYNLASIAIRQSNASLIKAAITYCQVGLAVADAFILCWKTKFTHMVERPSSFAARLPPRPKPYTKPRVSYFAEPPFPSFYSGHAVQIGATATVLTRLYGKTFAFTDSTHVGRLQTLTTYIQKITYQPRHYASFWAAARECAESRLLGGIHTRYDNEVGLAEGKKIGRHLNGFR